MKRTVLSIFALLGIMSAVSGCKEQEAHAQVKELPDAQVQITKVVAQNNAQVFESVGRVKNVRESMISSKAMGTITNVKVKAGDRVKKGQVLIRIDEKRIRGNVAQAQGALAQARAAKVIAKQMLDRFAKLKKADSASQAKYDKAQFDYDAAVGAVTQASGALTTARSYLNETIVKAPFAGTVVDTMMDVGEVAAPGMPLLRMEGESELEFEATVNGQDIDLIEIGQEVTVVVDAARGQRKEVAGKITEIVPSQDRVTHSNLVRIKLEDMKDVRSGTFGRAKFKKNSTTRGVIALPKDRLITHGQLSAVYVLDEEQTVRLRLIRQGKTLNEKIEIISGLLEGDNYISSDLTGLIDGQRGTLVKSNVIF